MAPFNGPDGEMFDPAEDVYGLTLDELRELPYQMQVGLDLSALD